jgi:hypothetical protein
VVAGVEPVSDGSAGVVVVVAGVVVVVSGVPSQAPKNPAKLNSNAKPKIFVFITPLSPIVAIKQFRLLNTITYFADFLNFLNPHEYILKIYTLDGVYCVYSYVWVKQERRHPSIIRI